MSRLWLAAGLLAVIWGITAWRPAASAAMQDLADGAGDLSAPGKTPTKPLTNAAANTPGKTPFSPATRRSPSPSATPQPVGTTVDPAVQYTPGVEASLFFSRPSTGERLISPIPVEAEIIGAEAGSVRLELVDLDNRVLARKVYQMHDCPLGTPAAPAATFSPATATPVSIKDPGAICTQQRLRIVTNLPFALSNEETLARLQIFLVDNKQRIRTLSSLDLTLLASGQAQPAGDSAAPATAVSRAPFSVEILQPAAGGMLRGKTLVVSGTAPLTKEFPLRVEVVSDGGTVINSRMVSVLPEKDGSTAAAGRGVFRVDISLKRLKAPAQAVVIISASDEVIPGMRYITSRAVFLDPG